jgi:hypothetical protein
MTVVGGTPRDRGTARYLFLDGADKPCRVIEYCIALYSSEMHVMPMSYRIKIADRQRQGEELRMMLMSLNE